MYNILVKVDFFKGGEGLYLKIYIMRAKRNVCKVNGIVFGLIIIDFVTL